VHSDRVRDGLAMLAPVLDSPPDDPEVHGQALLAYSHALGTIGRLGDGLAAADAAVALVRDEGSRVTAVTTRGICYLKLGKIELGLSDHEAATGIARGLGPEALGTALYFESQAQMEAGQLEVAASLLDEAELVLTDVDARHLPARHTFDGDLALLQDRPRDALQHYALALEHSQELRDSYQVYNQLIGIADALAMADDDAGALEVGAIAAAHITELGGSRDAAWHVQGRDMVLDSRARQGSDAAARAWRRGLNVAPGYRVTRAAEIARKARERTSLAQG
jgi:tetratricopeptide (TPR) repeat protein